MPANYDRRSPALFTFTRTAGVNSAPATIGKSGINHATPVVNPNTAAVTFAGIPAGVKRITAFAAALTSSVNPSTPIVRLGSGGSVQNTGYASIASQSTTTSIVTGAETTGAPLLPGGANSPFAAWSVEFERVSPGSNIWNYRGSGIFTGTGKGDVNGSVTLSGEVDRLQFTTVAGTPLLNGTMNISWEF